MIATGKVPVDIAIVQVTPPNAAGYCSLGVSVDAARRAMETAALAVGEITPRVPFTYGDTCVPVDRFDYLVKSQTAPIYAKRAPPDTVHDQVAAHVAALISDGSCIAFSFGPLFEALARRLAGRRDLGIHSPFFSDPLMDLVVCGAVSNRFKGTYRGKALVSYAVGTAKLFAWLNHNPLVDFQRVDKVFDPVIIGSNPRFVAVLPVRKIDLFGRVALHTDRQHLALGPGEMMDFFSAAEISEGGSAIIALRSRDRRGDANIRISIARYPLHFDLFESVDRVVTEYGVVSLRGRTMRERAQALIDISHPDDRSDLVRRARRRRILFEDQIFIRQSAQLYPGWVQASQNFGDGLTVRFRAIRPGDEEQMRRLFYRFSDDSVYYRYFQTVRAMPHTKMQEYVNVDWNQVMSLVGLTGPPGQGRIIAEGRYIRIPESAWAEVVFVVDDQYQRCGIATFLYGLLVRLARGQGVKGFMADVLFSNIGMMKVFRKGNLPLKAHLEDGVYHLSIPFEETV